MPPKRPRVGSDDSSGEEIELPRRNAAAKRARRGRGASTTLTSTARQLHRPYNPPVETVSGRALAATIESGLDTPRGADIPTLQASGEDMHDEANVLRVCRLSDDPVEDTGAPESEAVPLDRTCEVC